MVRLHRLGKGLDDFLTGPHRQDNSRLMSLAELDREIHRIQSNLLTRWQNTPQTVLLRRQRNTLTPIYKLPFDLISHILLLATSTYPWGVDRLQALGSVSKVWHEVVRNTPQLWCCLSLDVPMKVNGLVLEMNGSGSLTVICSGQERARSEVEAFMVVAVQHVRRWRHLHYIQPFLSQELAANFNQASSLEYITLEISDGSREGFLPVAPLTHPKTALRQLRAESITLDLTEDYKFANVQVMELLGTHPFPFLDTLFPLLSSTTRLMELYIWAPDLLLHEVARLEDNAGSLDKNQDFVVDLPRLEVLELNQFPRAMASTILSHIRIPSCHQIRMPNAILSSAALDIPSFHDTLSGLLRNAHEYVLEYHPRQGLLRFKNCSRLPRVPPSPPSPNFSEETCEERCECLESFLTLQLESRRHWKQIVTLLETSGSDVSTHLSFCPDIVDQASIPQEPCLHRYDILRDTPRVSGLQARGMEEARIMLSFLSHPYSDAHGVLRWPLPSFKDFAFVPIGDEDVGDLVALLSICMRQRSSFSQLSSKPATGSPLPLQRVIAPRKVCKALCKRKEFEETELFYEQ